MKLPTEFVACAATIRGMPKIALCNTFDHRDHFRMRTERDVFLTGPQQQVRVMLEEPVQHGIADR